MESNEQFEQQSEQFQQLQYFGEDELRVMTATMYPNMTVNMPMHQHQNYGVDGIDCTPADDMLGINDFCYMNQMDTVNYQIPNIQMDNNQPVAVAPYNVHDPTMHFPDPALASSPPSDICTYQTSRPLSPSASNKVQLIHRQLVKDTLKNTIQKRNHIYGNNRSSPYMTASKEEFTWQNNCCINSISSSSNDSHYGATVLTPEDEERRRKRRERNKIAATKCRNKKKEKAQNLVREAENLENTNISLKREIEELNAEARRLAVTLETHAGECQFSNQTTQHQHQQQDFYNPPTTVTMNVNFCSDFIQQFNNNSEF